MSIIEPRSGTAFKLFQGQRLKVIDLQGEQVSDLICYNANEIKEYLSSGRTFDYEETLLLSTGNKFYSNRSNIMFEIIEDTVGRHDFLLTPCGAETFKIIYGHTHPHQGCYGNLCQALKDYGIEPDAIPTTFNIFMNVVIKEDGKIKVLAPLSKANDYIILEAKMDLIVGLTACSAEQSNNFSFKPIGFEIIS